MPRIDASYWLALVAASTFGTNSGDFVAKYLHLGHLAGLPYMGLLFAAILLSARWARRGHALYFWAAIITMRTAATNVADALQDFHIPYHVSVPLVLALFAASVLFYKRTAQASAGDASTPVNSAYWLSMMLAGILGTVAGDFASFRIALTPPVAAALFGALILVSIAWFGRRGTLPHPVPYWTTVALIRTGGTAAGDAVAIALGLAASTALTGLAFVALVTCFYGRQRGGSVGLPPHTSGA
ncbi:MAG TPA: hypothetical protein VKE95_14530 [Burkholderiales bacterium]|nr:hypothetical protein [Burkholderiales bacterium]